LQNQTKSETKFYFHYMKLPVHFKQVTAPMNWGILFCLAHQFVVYFTDNSADADKCGLFSIPAHLKSDQMLVQ